MSAFREVEIDEILVWNPCLRSQSLEVTDRICIESECHGLLEMLGIGIPNGVGEVVFFSHSNCPYCLRSFRVALRAEMSLISFSS